MERILKKAAKHIVDNCADINENTKCLILYDKTTKDIINYFSIYLNNICSEISLIEIPVFDRHGEEPEESVCKKMLQVDVIFCITKYSLAHTNARKLANEKGIRFLSMPEYNKEMLKLNAIQTDYKGNLNLVEKISGILTEASNIEITTNLGTKLHIDATGRKGNCCPGFVNENYLLGSPPDIEANVAPVEEKTEGIIVVDGSITHEKIGVLMQPIKLRVENGKIVEIISEDVEKKEELKKIFNNINSNSLILGELGIGLNFQAELCGNMLVDEGTYGCIHFGFGSNWTIGGKNKVDFHLDFVIKDATMIVDGTVIFKEGELI